MLCPYSVDESKSFKPDRQSRFGCMMTKWGREENPAKYKKVGGVSMTTRRLSSINSSINCPTGVVPHLEEGTLKSPIIMVFDWISCMNLVRSGLLFGGFYSPITLKCILFFQRLILSDSNLLRALTEFAISIWFMIVIFIPTIIPNAIWRCLVGPRFE